ncbi:MAG: pyruvate ferredoxin oxidoreductase subunit gamma [Firmicutes bacterium]|nr:pyruvate ferredoxin oxidoreductase subunit gamma [Bacillota bacterium]
MDIRWHGRGGQGVVTAATLLGGAAVREGKYAHSFPAFGAERRGAPVMAFTKIREVPLRDRSQIYAPDYVAVMDETLLDVVPLLDGLKPGGQVIINTRRSSGDLGLAGDFHVSTVDATSIALDKLGVAIVNTTLLGAVSAATGMVSLESLESVIRESFRGSLAEKNIDAVRTAFRAVKEA